ncbi:AMP-binding protein [Aliiglaciecola sp. CAU 1673]|uniref:AMP-binding protein n=1 Tax=Aliiglaciecola sp. CAU 1673 TaxID=3032595 RepID=UPI0023DAF9F6|nr:AMP-binding protein [Aliiglaciecola sp. CAU 1673]MDF2176629.1 AMP-binding protein [Aliiglaciecola sp. CAU 1673]
MEFEAVTRWTTPQVLARQAAERPQKLAVSFIDGPSFTFQQLFEEAKIIAGQLSSIGFEAGDKLGMMLPNCPEFISLWLGCHQADGVMVALNTELVSDYLIHALNLSQCRFLACDSVGLQRLAAVKDRLEYLQQVIVISNDSLPSFDSLELRSYLQFRATKSCGVPAPPKSTFIDLACLLFTSGTTGPSKAVMMPHAHCYLFGQGTIDNLKLLDTDKYYICMPLFHANGLFMQLYACLITGATAVVRSKFSASNWIKDIAEYDITHTNLLGVMSEFIDRQPPSTLDKAHKLKVIAAAPAAPVFIEKFAVRFGVPMIELYGMSEVNIPLYTPMDKPRPGSCGKAYDKYFEVRIADTQTDLLLPPDTVGEIQVRPKLAGGFMSGYYQMPEKTLEAFRNLWFHTGDAGRCDKDGYFYFVDRIKDCLRRRGENISSFEVETTLLSFKGVQEAAVFGVPSDIPGGEQEVMAVIVTDGSIDANAIYQQSKQAMPIYAIPRFIRLVSEDQLPRTATNKIKKASLREQGITQDTWDAQKNL